MNVNFAWGAMAVSLAIIAIIMVFWAFGAVPA
jgi:hypothetical protein